jgi:hypothetical protein
MASQRSASQQEIPFRQEVRVLGQVVLGVGGVCQVVEPGLVFSGRM